MRLFLYLLTCGVVLGSGCVSDRHDLRQEYEAALDAGRIGVFSLKVDDDGLCHAAIDVKTNEDVAAIRQIPFASLTILGSERFSDLSLLTNMPLVSLDLNRTAVMDLSPLSGMLLTNFSCSSSTPIDISPLQGMPLRSLDFSFCEVTNWSVISGLPLEVLDADYSTLEDLGILRGLRLSRLSINDTKVSDLSSLRGMPLAFLDVSGCPVTNLAPLSGMPLKELIISKTQVSDLTPLKGMRLERIELDESRVTDLSPLKGMPIKSIKLGDDICAETGVTDLTALQGMKLKKLSLRSMKVSDLSPLKGMKLEDLDIAHTQVEDLAPLKGMPLRDLDIAGCTNIRDVAVLERMPLEELDMYDTAVTDLQPLSKSKLKKLWAWTCDDCDGDLTDLSPLRGLPLKELNIKGTKVRDLSPLKGMPLMDLNITGAEVTDVSPLAGSQLMELEFSAVRIQKGMEVLREIATIKQIAPSSRYLSYTPAEFWKLYEEGYCRYRPDIVEKVEWNSLYEASVSSDATLDSGRYNFEGPVVLSSNRVEFMDKLAGSRSSPAIELLRQHIYDSDRDVLVRAFVLLEEMKDVPSLYERFIQNSVRFTDGSEQSRTMAAAFLEGITNNAAVREMLSHSKVKEGWSGHFDVGTWDWDKERVPTNYSRSGLYDFKTGTTSGGRGEGVLDETKLGLRRGWQEISGSGMRCLESPGEAGDINAGDLYWNRPLTNGWARVFARQASAPFCSEGKYFMADGHGRLICGSIETGAVLWSVPLPLSPYAKFSLQGGILHVAFACDLETQLVCSIDSGNGSLLALELELSADKKVCREVVAEHVGYEIRPVKEKEGFTVICKKDGLEQWSHSVDCEIEDILVRNEKVYLLGRWNNSYKALACLNLASGSVEWVVPLDGGSGDFKLCAEDDDRFWFFDDDSFVECIDKATGDRVLSIRLSAAHYSSPLTAFYLDPVSDRLIVDPSHGVIYSFPRATFFEAFARETPIKGQSSFGYAFRKEVLVERSDFVIRTVSEAGTQIDEPSGDEPRSVDDPSSQLFSQFASTFGGSKFHYSVNGWFERWKAKEEAMMAKATENGLDSDELLGCLAVIRPKLGDKLAMTPISAHRIRFDDEDAWVIVCSWEYAYEEDGRDWLMGHVRIWAISIKTKKILAFATCG